MSDKFFSLFPVAVDLGSDKDRHYDRIVKLRKAFEREMYAYIEKYVLDGRELGEVFPVAHYSAVNDVEEKGYVYGHCVLEHIIEYEDEFLNETNVKLCYDTMVATGHIAPKSDKT